MNFHFPELNSALQAKNLFFVLFPVTFAYLVNILNHVVLHVTPFYPDNP